MSEGMFCFFWGGDRGIPIGCCHAHVYSHLSDLKEVSGPRESVERTQGVFDHSKDLLGPAGIAGCLVRFQ